METLTKFEVKEITWFQKTFLAKRAKISMDKLPDFFKESYGAIYEAIKKTGAKVSEPPIAIFYSIDEEQKVADLAAAVPINDQVKEIEGFERVVIPKSKVLAVTHYGSYENMGPAYAALEKYLLEHRLKKGWTIEEYYSDPSIEKDPAKWKTNVYFVVHE